MTTQETERVDATGVRSGSTRSSDKAYERRMRRNRALADRRLTRTGSPISSSMTRVPFVVLVILLLTGGVVGVLWLNTMSDATGLRASESRLRQAALTTDIQAASRSVQALRDPSVLESEASALGMVPAGDAAILAVGPDGKATVVGTPSVVPSAVATSTGPLTTAPATTAPRTTPPKATAPRTTPKVIPPKVTPRAAAPKTTAPKAAAPRTTAPKAAAPRTTAPKAAAPKTTAPKTTTSATRAARAPTTATTRG